MTKKIITILLLLLAIPCISQTVETASFEFDFQKAIKNSRHFEVHNSGYFVQANKNQKKIQIRFKIKSTTKKKIDFDPNKFFLISDTYKTRTRPVDMKHNHAMGTFLGFRRLINESQLDPKKHYAYSYDPSVKDTFLEFKMDGYEDIDNCINFGTNNKPRNKSVYFEHKDIKSNTVDVYFIVPKEFQKGKIYYGNTQLAEFDVK